MASILKEFPLLVFIHSRPNKNDAVSSLSRISKSITNKISIDEKLHDCLEGHCDTLSNDNVYTENKFVVCHSEPEDDELLTRKFIWDSKKTIIEPNWFVCSNDIGGLFYLMACKGNLIVNNKSWQNKFTHIKTCKTDIPFSFDTPILRYFYKNFFQKLAKTIGTSNPKNFNENFTLLIESEIKKNLSILRPLSLLFQTSAKMYEFTITTLLTHEKNYTSS